MSIIKKTIKGVLFQMGQYEIQSIDARNHAAYVAMSHDYEAEFASLTGAVPDRDGIYPLSTEIDETHHGYLLYDDKIPIGFIVIFTGKRPYDICEFYIEPAYRKKDLGRYLAYAVFSVYGGAWTVKQLVGAHRARKFWRKILSEYVPEGFQETTYNDSQWGQVTMQSFDVSKIMNGE